MIDILNLFLLLIGYREMGSGRMEESWVAAVNEWTRKINCWSWRVGDGQSLVGIVECHDISKISDTDTDPRHEQTCPKKAQKSQTFEKNVLPSMLFSFFHASYSSCPKESKNAIKNEKCQYFFSPGHHSTYENLQNVGVVTNANVGRIL